MIGYLVPVVIGCFIAWAEFYAPLRFPQPFQNTTIANPLQYGVAAPLEGALTPNSICQHAPSLFKGKIFQPETVIFDAEDRIYLFTLKGIYRALPKGDGYDDPEFFSHVIGGRPLSGAFDSEGNIYFCDTIQGLGYLNVTSRTSKIIIGRDRIKFCDDLVVSSQGDVFIADASSTLPIFAPESILLIGVLTTISGHKTGRLLSYTPNDGILKTLIENLTFANGIELSHDESFVIVTDGGDSYRNRRYWLKGDKAGTDEIFVRSFPGGADGISRSSSNTYWMAIFSRIDRFQYISQRSRLMRWLFVWLPAKYKEAIVHNYGIVDQNGNFLRSFHCSEMSDFGRVTSAVEHKGKLYLGSFFDSVKVIDLNMTRS